MDQELEKRLKKKIMAGEELTDEEKRYFVNYDEWKQAHDAQREDLISSYRWSVWPFLFICAFFLLSTAFTNTRMLKAAGPAAVSIPVTVVSWILGIAGVVASFWMKNKAARIAEERRKASQLVLNPEMAEAEEAAANTAGSSPSILKAAAVNTAALENRKDTAYGSENCDSDVCTSEGRMDPNGCSDSDEPTAEEEEASLTAMHELAQRFRRK